MLRIGTTERLLKRHLRVAAPYETVDEEPVEERPTFSAADHQLLVSDALHRIGMGGSNGVPLLKIALRP